MKLNSKFLRTLWSYSFITLASGIYALGVCWCFTPNSIAIGGITGVAQIIHAGLPWAPIGTLVILLNIPLFFLGWRFIGMGLLVSSLYAMFVSSLMIDGLDLLHRFQPMDPMLAAIFGGLLMGLSLGFVFREGATTGGTDLAARLLKLKLAWLPMGRLLMIVDLVVILAVAVAFRSLSSALYGLVALYIATIVMDGVLYGLDTAKVAYIISSRHDEICAAITGELDRGVTLLQGRGGYTGEEKQVLLCAFKQREIVTLRQVVNEIDPGAFLIVCNAHEVLGDGFRAYKKDDL